ncbi:amino acid adenylation domain protein [Kribbella flavida DSM 17836]|uniref:Amino acid adenylation domain protein n=1 Tax=Kribbella flavida (strain DSM 17836 / JCM 10339 / NBRC 14399) TaxID=479435 RepID=D2PSN1_KRIFD|nr:non-ribosomal peptide synthetase [Kribbella flavida]ADB33169.1 amino acid adenylation domain protein [Kribbella flavida DSM 17836]
MSSMIVGPTLEHHDAHTVVDLFLRQVAQRPDAPAVSHLGRTLSYHELDVLSAGLAARLLDAGVEPGDLTPFVLSTGLEIPVAMLATMRVRAAFVPMDACWPAARLDQVLTAMSPKVALVRAGAGKSLPGAVLEIDLTAPAGADRPAAVDRLPGLDDLIYGFYTSGSTGMPKCALNLHRGVRNRFAYMSHRFGATPDDVVLQNSPHVFDSSVWQMLWPLTKGAQVVIPDRSGVVDLQDVVSTIERHGVTMTDFVPSVFNVLVELLVAQPPMVRQLRSMRHLLIGGEEMLADPVQTFRRLLPHVRITNTYGPTEASIGMVFHEVRDVDVERIPIGLPIANTCLAILGADLQPVERGEVGDLWIGGECIGAGYLDDPERTNLAFADNHLPGLPTGRLYRTGDRAVVGADGLVGFRGRTDDQVKVNGMRVEIGEIEAALRGCPGLTDARAAVYVDPAGRNCLAGFVTGRNPIEAATVLDHARRSLPAGLVPSRIIQIEAMPLNQNGKLDRNQLAGLAADYHHTATADVSDPIAIAVQTAWNRFVPGGPDGDFFAAGGDSLTAVRLTLQINERLGTSLTVQDLVAAPTIAALTERISSGPVAGEDPEADLLTAVADAVLSGDVRPAGEPVTTCEQIFLTGATGFIGTHLLHGLLRHTDGIVHCLVRADDASTALDRIHDSLLFYHLDATDLDRVVPVVGDLSLPRFGLGQEEWDRLASVVDVVVHNGAMVNLVLGYRSHRAANVLGTAEVLRLATTGRHKALHHISSLSMLEATPGRPESAPTPLPPATNGYSLSKWAAERLVEQAADRGLAVAAYRLGEVMPHSVTGVPSPKSLPDLIVRWNVRLGLAFRSPIVLDYTPIDQVTTLVTTGVRTGARGWFHLAQAEPIRLDDLLAEFAVEFGLESVPYRDFWLRLQDQALSDGLDDDMAALLAMLPAARPDVPDQVLDESLKDLFGEAGAGCSRSRSLSLLTEAGVRLAAADAGVLRRYTAHYRRVRRAALRSEHAVG